MKDWENYHYFAVLAREGTLSAASKRLGVNHATVARRVAALEAATSLKLIDRRAHATELTADGKRIAAVVALMEDAAFAVERAVHAAKPIEAIEVAISAPPSLATVLIAPNLIRLRQDHPGIRIRLIGEKRFAALNRRDADIALRLSRPKDKDSTLIARKVGSFGFRLYGAPHYLRNLSKHRLSLIAYDGDMDDAPQQKWLLNFAADHKLVLRTSDLETQAAAARAGVGLAMLPQFLGDPDPNLQCYPHAHTPISRDIWLLTHRDLRRMPAIRSVSDFLKSCLS